MFLLLKCHAHLQTRKLQGIFSNALCILSNLIIIIIIIKQRSDWEQFLLSVLRNPIKVIMSWEPRHRTNLYFIKCRAGDNVPQSSWRERKKTSHSLVNLKAQRHSIGSDWGDKTIFLLSFRLLILFFCLWSPLDAKRKIKAVSIDRFTFGLCLRSAATHLSESRILERTKYKSQGNSLTWLLIFCTLVHVLIPPLFVYLRAPIFFTQKSYCSVFKRPTMSDE